MRIPFALFAFALVVRACLFVLYPDAAYPDSYYYVEVARALHAGNGFNVDFIYSFLDVGGRIPPNPTLPIPSNGFWMPLASIVQLPTMWLLGPTTLASALPFIVVGSLGAPLTWLIAREIGVRPAVALAAGMIHEVAVDYGIRWLVLERAHIVAPLAPVIKSLVRPSWLGPPIYTIPYTGARTGDPAVDGAPALVIYPVCFAATDTRCGSVMSASRTARGSGIGRFP